MHAPPTQLTSFFAILPLLLSPWLGAQGGVLGDHPHVQAEELVTTGEESPGTLNPWHMILGQDARIKFTRRSAHEGGKILDGEESTELEHCVALMAIGCATPRPVRERPLLERWSREGSERERAAALLALGEFGEGADTALLAALEDPSPLLRNCAMLGLLRSGRQASRLRVEAIAEGSSEDAPNAKALLLHHADPRQPDPIAEFEMLFDLRWAAARRYGLVDGQTWKTRLLKDLLQNQDFMEGVVLGAIAVAPPLGATDHLLNMLLEENTPARLHAAVVAMPEQLSMMVEAGLWQPGDVVTWKNILGIIEQEGSERDSLGMLSQTLLMPALAIRSLRLLTRAGLPEVLVELDGQWDRLSKGDRIQACLAWATAGRDFAPTNLMELAQDANPLLRAHLMISAARLGDADAHAELRDTLSDLEHIDFPVTLAAAMAHGASPLVRDYLDQLLEHLEGSPQREVAVILCLNGISTARKVLAAHLRDEFPGGTAGLRCIEALSVRDPAEFVDLFIKHFPVEDDLALNVGLARAIVAAQHNNAYAFLRQALWYATFDLSVLSAGVIVQVGGIHTLRDELNRGPQQATPRDLRRIGFALGEWGGLDEVKLLKRRRSLRVNDPVLQGALLGALGRRTH